MILAPSPLLPVHYSRDIAVLTRRPSSRWRALVTCSRVFPLVRAAGTAGSSRRSRRTTPRAAPGGTDASRTQAAASQNGCRAMVGIQLYTFSLLIHHTCYTN